MKRISEPVMWCVNGLNPILCAGYLKRHHLKSGIPCTPQFLANYVVESMAIEKQRPPDLALSPPTTQNLDFAATAAPSRLTAPSRLRTDAFAAEFPVLAAAAPDRLAQPPPFAKKRNTRRASIPSAYRSSPAPEIAVVDSCGSSIACSAWQSDGVRRSYQISASPTLSSVFSDPDGESTRRLNEDIARVTAPRKLPINWEAAHRKWPEFYAQPKKNRPIFDDQTDTKPLNGISSKSAHTIPKYLDDTTEDAWNGSKRTRSEMQPRVDNEPDLPQIVSRPAIRNLSTYGLTKSAPHNPSPLSKIHNQSPPRDQAAEKERQVSIDEALEKLRKASSHPGDENRRVSAHDQSSPNMSSAKSSLTAVPPSPPPLMSSPGHDASNGRSFFMPDISHLDEFVTGTLRFSGSTKNGVPILVKHGQVHDQKERPFGVRYAEVDGVEIPEDEEKIFVSMDMIREEIVSLQEHHDKIQDYAGSLQHEVERLESQLRSRKSVDGGLNVFNANEQVLTQKKALEAEVASLQKRLDQATHRISTSDIENDTLAQERDRVISRLQEACEDINKLTRKLSVKEKELETTHKQLGSSEQIRQDNDTLRRDVAALKQGRDGLEHDNASLRAELEALRREQQRFREEAESLRPNSNGGRHDHQSLISENRSLRTNNRTLMEENEDLRENLDGVQHELDAAREEIETLQREIQSLKREKVSLREDNDSLVRHNEKYFSENKILRRENSGFERSIHDLHERNLKLKEELEALKRQFDRYRPSGKSDFSTRREGETEENMTSAFFVPDITIKTNDTGPVDATETKDMPDLPELTSHTDDLTGGNETGRQESQTTQKRDATSQSDKADARHRSKSSVKSSPSKNSGTAQKVAFALPDKAAEKPLQGSKSTVANQGSKRRSVSRLFVPELDPFGDEDTTGMLSVDNITQDLAISLNLNTTDHKDGAAKQARSQNVGKPAPKIVHIDSKSQASKKTMLVNDAAVRAVRISDKDICPSLSNNARRILDDLCAHNCQNCTVCTRITSHSGIISSTDLAVGKKRVSIPRPVPVSDRGVAGGDHTVRPAHSPGYALAVVIKGLEDESQHLQLELTRLQARYNRSDKSMGRRERLALAEAIRLLLKRVEAKSDQIYSLYDVLEGQKAAGQEMTEEEVEMTVLNITGMTVRDVTNMSDQGTWEGIVEA
ncbi:rho coiled-coil associated kinase alpha [Trichoderma arundinaceum]|uniref:Rho coiled-coil associated kinase alpha n=1 Tax=Trichoderma arundinaceum TaxID=490622 RepID=A0A395P056_TRIAR|nr:rho coiled-coil associated kinase alpha [Trichoderma arundinaceum]